MDEQGTLLQSDELVWHLICSHYLDHESICSFAAMSKVHNQRMLDLAVQRKKLLPCGLERHTKEHIKTIRHKYGNACCYAYKSGLGLGLNSLDDNGKSKLDIKFFDGFVSPLPCRSVPFFNKEGVLCFYGYGTVKAPGIGDSLCSIVLYGLHRLPLCCMMRNLIPRVRDDEFKYRYISLGDFLEYPVLLEAILNSTIVTKRRSYYVLRAVMEFLDFSLKGVTLPDNYADKVEFACSDEKGTKIYVGHLTDEIKEAIRKHYEEQPKNDKDFISL